MVAFQTTQLEIQKPQEVERLKPSMITPQHPLLAQLIRHQYKYMYWGMLTTFPQCNFQLDVAEIGSQNVIYGTID